MSDPKANQYSRCHWSQIPVPGELKSNPLTDTRNIACSIKVCERGAHHSGRFFLGFTPCRSIMRLWEFDRLRGIASAPFESINMASSSFLPR